jgi:hypothetical protein
MMITNGGAGGTSINCTGAAAKQVAQCEQPANMPKGRTADPTESSQDVPGSGSRLICDGKTPPAPVSTNGRETNGCLVLVGLEQGICIDVGKGIFPGINMSQSGEERGESDTEIGATGADGEISEGEGTEIAEEEQEELIRT